jgi:membrane-associated phospholipid phosphatase
MGADLILHLQRLSHPVLDRLFILASLLVSEEAILIVIPLIYWLYDKRLGFVLGVLFCASSLANQWLKELFALPRPSAAQVRVLFASSGGGYGFPSGHAQNSTVFWGTVALLTRSRRWWLAGAGVVALVCLSRLYLGLHFLADVIGGVAVGAVLLLAFSWLSRRLTRKTSAAWCFLAAGTLAAPLCSSPVGLKIGGALVGMGLGSYLEEIAVGFVPRTSRWRQISKALLGLGLLTPLYLATRPIAATPAGEFFAYLALSLAGFLGVPWLFRRLGWG